MQIFAQFPEIAFIILLFISLEYPSRESLKCHEQNISILFKIIILFFSQVGFIILVGYCKNYDHVKHGNLVVDMTTSAHKNVYYEARLYGMVISQDIVVCKEMLFAVYWFIVFLVLFGYYT